MYPAVHARTAPDRLAVVMAGSGERVTYAELDDRSARLATLLHAAGLRPGDVVLLVLRNDLRWGEIAWACWRSGLVLAPVNWHLTSRELAPLVEDAAPRAVITSTDLVDGVRDAGADPTLVVGDGYDEALPPRGRFVETMGGRLLFSSGTTGRPKPFRLDPPGVHPADAPLRSGAMMRHLDFTEGESVYLSTGPAYHAAPIGFLQSVHQLGGTVVLMEGFDAEAALAAIERHRVTHSQWVPTMFVRLLRLPADVRGRYDLSTHRVAVHGAAPCPPSVKRALMDWWGPIVYEYYGASEGYGRTAITPQEWLAHPGSVGRAADGGVRVADPDGRPLGVDEVGAVWFVRPGAVEPARAADGSADLAGTPGWGTVGDLGRIDADGYLHLTGRSGQLIITGGVNVYPREVEDVLAPHPDVADVAVLGVPDEEYGERVVAVVQPADGVAGGPDLASALIGYCRSRLAHVKCPRSVEFVARLPRSDAGKIQLSVLRATYAALPCPQPNPR